jgi:hypothetical protein
MFVAHCPRFGYIQILSFSCPKTEKKMGRKSKRLNNLRIIQGIKNKNKQKCENKVGLMFLNSCFSLVWELLPL